MASPVPVLITRYAALDAEVIRHQGFNCASEQLTRLIRHAKAGRIGLCMSEVNVREVRKGIRDRVAEARGAIRNKDFRTRTGILRLVGPYQNLLQDIDVKAIVAELDARFTAFLSDASVREVGASHLTIGPVLNQYFDVQPPFQPGDEKKAEFPDAISILALAADATALGQQVYFVSSDKGARQASATTGVLIPREKLEELNEMLAVAEIDDSRSVAAAQAGVKQLEPQVIARLVTDFSNAGFTLTSDEEGEVEDVVVSRVTIEETYLDEIVGDTAEFNVAADIEYDADVIFDDPEAIFYSEGDRYVLNKVSGVARATEPVTATVRIRFSLTDKTPELLDVQTHVGDSIEVPLEDFVPRRDSADDD